MDGATWLQRYLDGDRDGVWQELRQLGGLVRDPRFVRAARAVCDEAARRARCNVETIVGRLQAQGYRFHGNDDDQAPTVPFVPATPGAAGYVAWLESTIGPVPLLLSSWIRLVGDVWLVGTHPRWPTSSDADPLVIEVERTRYPDRDARGAVLHEFEFWRDQSGTPGPYRLTVAPDALHKANVSGGAPYGIVLPDRSAEGWIVAEEESSFLSYLRAAFDHGGFPGDPGDGARQAVIRELARDLLPL